MKKRTWLSGVLPVAVIICHLLYPKQIAAHGVGYRLLSKGRPVTMEFYYSSGKPISYAEIKVFSPDNQTLEYQNGRTDRKGRFAFHPETEGVWTVDVNDGMGHQLKGQFLFKNTNEIETGPAPPPAKSLPSKPMAVIMGISLIFNVFAAVSRMKKKR